MEELSLMESIAAHFGEVLVGVILTIFGFAFQSWAKSLRVATDRILTKLEGLVIEFHNHRVDIENRVTRVETKVDLEAMERREARAAFREMQDQRIDALERRHERDVSALERKAGSNE